MTEFRYVIQDALGLHARPSTELVQLVKSLNCNVEVEKAGKKVEADRLMGLMALAVTQGDEIKVTVEGKDVQEEKEAVEKLKKFFCEKL